MKQLTKPQITAILAAIAAYLAVVGACIYALSHWLWSEAPMIIVDAIQKANKITLCPVDISRRLFMIRIAIFIGALLLLVFWNR